jgi:hypothetical protein
MIRPVLLVCAMSGCRAQARPHCDEVSAIRVIPMKGERVDDAAYNRLLVQGCAVVPCLIDRIVDTSPMRDPRKAPPYEGVTVGDVALFILDDLTGRQFDDALPEDIKRQLPERGVYAYFEHVRMTKNRRSIQENWKNWLQTHPHCR